MHFSDEKTLRLISFYTFTLANHELENFCVRAQVMRMRNATRKPSIVCPAYNIRPWTDFLSSSCLAQKLRNKNSDKRRMASSSILVIVLALFVHVGESTLVSTNKSCPTWLYLSEEGWCTCGSSLLNVIMCNNISQQVGIQNSFCLTSFNPDQDPKEPVVGRCLYVQNHGKYIKGGNGLYFEVDQNISKQDHLLCDYLNREGRLCGACKQNHYIPLYSYDFKCYQCHRGLLSNILIYLTVAYLPLTIFLVIVVIHRVSVTSPKLNVAVLLCQYLALSPGLRMLTQLTRNTLIYKYIQFAATVNGIWNLDFFRELVPPICLPLATMQVIALDYLVAIYPLLLLVCLYALVTARDRGCKLVVRLWRPFYGPCARITQIWNVRDSIINAFATFLLLSYIKLISVSVDMLSTTKIFKSNGDFIGYYMYLDATVEFMSQEHMPYFIIATSALFIGTLFPLLLILYPMKWFQVFLNKCHLNSPGLRMFIELFQGYYCDRTDGRWDCRWFAAIYPILRIGGSLVYALMHDDLIFPLYALLTIVVMVLLLLINPYKQNFKIYMKYDLCFFSVGAIFCTSMTITQLSFDWDDLPPACGFITAGILALVPFLYLSGIVFKRFVYILRTKLCPQLKHNILSVWQYKRQRHMYQEI